MEKEMNEIAGIRFVSSVWCADRVQFRFPHSKKSRIRKKWLKRDCNFRYVPWERFIHDTKRNIIYGHPTMLIRLQAHCSLLQPTKLQFTP